MNKETEGKIMFNLETSIFLVQLIESKDQQIKDLEELLRAAENYIDKSPCDPDITTEQINAFNYLTNIKQSYQKKYPKQ